EQRRSFLIDAGAEYTGYAADITRSYAANEGSEYAQLIKDMKREELELIATMKAGVRYTEYHQQMNFRIASLLINHQLVNGLSAEAMVKEDLTGP
ncbi:M24 family metallopeptidase, partial [Erwinia amylovora]|uniref:M24 family metallopeptidase n=1 Tax=Erwinia amylovora TaxID=552 RepID=UPI0020BF8BED